MTVKSFLVKIGADDSELQKALGKARKTLKDHSAQFRKAGMAMTAAGAAITGAVGMMVKGYIKAGDEVHKMALRTGFSTEALSELKYAAEISGANIQALEKGVKRMAKTITDADEGMATYIRSFDRIGIKVEELRGLSPEQQFDKIAKSIAAVEDPTIRAATAQDIFGRAGTQLLPLFAAGEKGLDALRKKARDMGIVFDQEAANKAATLQDSLTTLKGSFQGVTMSIASALVPVITSLVDKVSSVATKIKDWMKEHPKLAGTITKIVLAIGGLMAVLGPLVMILPALVSGFTLLIGPIGLVIAAVAGLSAAGFLVVKNWEKIKGFFVNIWQSIANFATDIFNSVKKAIIDSIYWIVDKVAKIPIVKKFAGPWKESLEKIRAELTQTEEAVSEKSIQMGKDLLEGIQKTKLFAKVSGFLGDKVKGLASIFTTTKKKTEELSKGYVKASDEIKDTIQTLTDEVKKATLSEYEYSKWALKQKYIERKAAIEAEKAAEHEKNEALALLNESYRLQMEELDKEHKEKEKERQATHLEELKEGYAAYHQFMREQFEAYLEAKKGITDSINQLTMSELEYTIWALNQEYEERKKDIERTIQDEEEKAELLGFLNEEYRLKEEKARREYAEKLTALETNTLNALTSLYGNFISGTLQAFADWGEGTKGFLEGVGEAFKGLARDAVQALKDIVTQELVAAAKTIISEKAKAIAKIITKVIAAVPFPFNLAVVGGAIAAVTMLFKKIKLFGEGGIAWKPQLAVVGEKGPELITPLSKLGAGGGIGGGAVIRQYNYFYGNITNAGSMDEISNRLAEKTRRAIERGRK
jgi:hypothetical protein